VGSPGNVFVCNLQTAQALFNKDDFRDRLKYVVTTMDSSLLNEIGAYVGVPEVYIGLATADTANITDTATYAFVWTDAPALLHARTPTLTDMTFACCPVTDPGTAMTWRDSDPTARTDKASYLFDVDEIIPNNIAGVIFQDVLT